MFKYSRKNNCGFTLIELIVSISIIGILTVVFIADFRAAGKKGDLSAAAQQMVSDIRKVQSYTLGLKEFDPGSGLDSPDGGWGVFLTRQTPRNIFYKIFADYDNNLICNNINCNTPGFCRRYSYRQL